MEFRQLQHFLAAARLGSITEAADEFRISQPALSKSIRTLERTLGVRLLERGRFGVVPTAYGEVLLGHARTLDDGLAQAQRAIEAMRGHGSGRLTIGCGPSEATRLLPLALARFRGTHPDVRVTVLYGLNEALMPMVKRGEVDFALSSVPRTASDPQLSHATLYTDQAAVVARDGHPLAGKRSVRPADLLGWRWVLARRRELERRALDEVFLNAGLKPVEAEIETTSAVLMKSVVAHSDFLSFMPRELIHWEERAGQLRALRVAAQPWTRAVGVTRRRGGATAQGAAGLVDALIDALQHTAAELARP
jgi:DNA-binding transcriptional LysR family regulator